MDLRPVTLSGTHVRLEPYRDEQILELWGVANFEQLWQYMPFEVSTAEQFAAFVHRMMRNAETGVGIGFAQRALAKDVLVGGTSFMSYDGDHRRVEIGATWITPSWQRTAVNTEAKLLLLTHAFESLDCVRVEFKTDALNVQSRRALNRIGAAEEGTLRAHMIMPGGRLRDSVYFSILQTEWPSVKQRLRSRLDAADAAGHA